MASSVGLSEEPQMKRRFSTCRFKIDLAMWPHPPHTLYSLPALVPTCVEGLVQRPELFSGSRSETHTVKYENVIPEGGPKTWLRPVAHFESGESTADQSLSELSWQRRGLEASIQPYFQVNTEDNRLEN